MLGFLLRNLFVAGGRKSPGTFLRLLRHEPFSKPYTTSPSSPKSDLSVSFFQTSCGLSPAAALSAAAKLNMKTTENAESVLLLLQSYGFTKSNIAIIAAKLPVLFRYHPEKCIKPKIDLFLAAGLTENFVQKILTREPYIFNSSLEKRLGPNLHLLMNIIGVDKKAVATSIDRGAWILITNTQKTILPNIETLRKHGAGANIAKLVARSPRTINQEAGRFSKTVAYLEHMGFDPSKALFMRGLQVIAGLSPPAWERKLQLYRSIGFSQEETLSAFKKEPKCMFVSEEKVRKMMAFFAENLKWKPSHLAAVPMVLSFSFEKRIVPRYAIFNILSTSGLLRKNISFPYLLYMSESNFLKYLCNYSEKALKLLEVYKVELDMAVTVPPKVTVPSKCVIRHTSFLCISMRGHM